MIKALVESSHVIGRGIPIWTQGAGSNLSCKEGNRLAIKASGFRLDAVSSEAGVAEVDLARFDELLREPGADPEMHYMQSIQKASLSDSPQRRPSMETGFHAALPGKWVCHFHSLAAVLLADEYFSGERDLIREFPHRVAFLPPIMPGNALTQAIRALPADTECIILQNHGVILQSDRAPVEENGIFADWRRFERRFSADRGYGVLAEILSAEEDPLAWAKKRLVPAPLAIYFPDTAVFKARILAVLVPAGAGLFRLTEDAWTRDRDAAEIWAATAILYGARPGLRELPLEISEQVAGLPTEKIRSKS